MTARVILKATRGNLGGEEFVFTGRTHCVLGRADGCSLRVPGDDLTVSRYHCLLEIDAPVAWVEDLGSRNGTFVNGELIGQRDRGRPTEEISPPKASPRLLVNGDELHIGCNVFEVVIDEMPGTTADSESMAEPCMAVT